MSKVYIVTTGSYSDYSIHRCFLDKEMALKYISVSNCLDINDLEEYDLDDNIEFKPVEYVEITYGGKPNSFYDGQLKLKINNGNNIEFYARNGLSSDGRIVLTRLLPDNYDIDVVESKYLKVCQDLSAKIKSLLEIEGWDNKMIQDWFNKNQSKYQ